jgi:hypothetical protein
VQAINETLNRVRQLGFDAAPQPERSESGLQSYRIRDLSLCCIRPRILWANYFLHQRFETRIAPERIEQRINFNPSDV